jgi:hypothetical protein
MFSWHRLVRAGFGSAWGGNSSERVGVRRVRRYRILVRYVWTILVLSVEGPLTTSRPSRYHANSFFCSAASAVIFVAGSENEPLFQLYGFQKAGPSVAQLQSGHMSNVFASCTPAADQSLVAAEWMLRLRFQLSVLNHFTASHSDQERPGATPLRPTKGCLHALSQLPKKQAHAQILLCLHSNGATPASHGACKRFCWFASWPSCN